MDGRFVSEPDHVKQKDINDMVNAGITEISEMINKFNTKDYSQKHNSQFGERNDATRPVLLPTQYQQFIHLSRYARWDYENERETQVMKQSIVISTFPRTLTRTMRLHFRERRTGKR